MRRKNSGRKKCSEWNNNYIFNYNRKNRIEQSKNTCNGLVSNTSSNTVGEAVGIYIINTSSNRVGEAVYIYIYIYKINTSSNRVGEAVCIYKTNTSSNRVGEAVYI